MRIPNPHLHAPSSELPINEILQGNCIEILKTLPERSVDLIFADPPYNLQLRNELLRPNQTVVDGVDDEWDQFSGFEEYDTFTRNWLSECRRVLKDNGTLWVIGSYHNIFRVGSILMDLGYWILNDVVWNKCLAGNTELFALINDQPIVSTLKDLVRINLFENSVKLPSYDEHGCPTWVDLIAWQRTQKSRGLYIELEDGSWVECTPSHRFPIMRQGRLELVAAEHLRVDDILIQLSHFELPHTVLSNGIDRSLGEFIGWYLAEGSFQTGSKGIQLSLAANEQPIAQTLLDLIRDKFGVLGRIHCYDSCLHLIFSGHFMVELIQRFVRGNSSSTKRLAREAFLHGTDFLAGILAGYLQGDGHWDENASRWRIGLCKNKGLVTDLAIICRITRYRIRFKDVMFPYQRGIADGIRGEIRENRDDGCTYVSLEALGLPPRGHFAHGQRHSLKLLREKYKWSTRKSRENSEMPALARQVIYGNLRPVRIRQIRAGTRRGFYDLTVTGNHIFALANGLLTHNSNPMPNFRGTRFTNATETLIWAKKSVDQKKYTFNYHSMKNLNDEKQMQNVWHIPLCTGEERIKINGKKAHSTQKPETLLYRVILSSSNPGDVVLDPFFGSGTTGAVAKKLNRDFIGIELESDYIEIARTRINNIQPSLFGFDETVFTTRSKRTIPRVSFGQLLEAQYLKAGQRLYSKMREYEAVVKADSQLVSGNFVGSIHQVAAHVQGQAAFNGWDFWYYEDESGGLVSIDKLRERYRQDNNLE